MKYLNVPDLLNGNFSYMGSYYTSLFVVCFHVQTSRNTHVIFGNRKKFCRKDLAWLLLSECWPCLGGKFSSWAFADPECT